MTPGKFGREVQVWTTGFLCCRPTETEAGDYVRHVVEEKGDREAIDNLVRIQRMDNRNVPPDEQRARRARLMIGWGGHSLVGTPEQITDELLKLSLAALDGLVILWVNNTDELRQWNRGAMPLWPRRGYGSLSTCHPSASG